MNLFNRSLLILVISTNTSLAFDMPKMPSVPTPPALPKAPPLPTANPETEKLVNGYIKKSNEAGQFMHKSVDALFKIIAPKDKVQKVEADTKAAESLQDSKQKAEGLRKIYAVRSQIVNEILNNEKAMKALGSLSSQDKVSLGKIAYNLHLATNVDKELISEGPEVIKAASSDPVLLKRADEIKNSMSETKEQLENGQKIIVGVGKLAGLIGIKIEVPKSAKDAAK